MNIVNSDKQLTIVMPTYNRRERMLNQLLSIYNYGDINYYYLVIVDNCSNYDVMEAIRKTFPVEFVDNIEYHRNPINTKLGFNISLCFLFAKSKYLLQISDDDEFLSGFMDKIKLYIEKYPNVSCIQFNVGWRHGNSDGVLRNNNHNDIIVSSLKELYNSKRHSPAYFMFIGNKIYNLEALESYLSDIFAYNYTAVSFILPLLHSLWDSKGTFVMSDLQLGVYINADGDSWNYIKVLLGMATLYDVEWSDGSNYNQINYINSVLCGLMRANIVKFLGLCVNKEPAYRNYIYNRIMTSIYRDWRKHPMEWIYVFSYRIEILTKLPVITKIIPSILTYYSDRISSIKDQQRQSNGLMYRLYKKIKQ